jgi:hypothetical protein
MLVTVKYNLEAILMTVYYLVHDMIIYFHGIQVGFFQVHVKYGSPVPVKIIKYLLVVL